MAIYVFIFLTLTHLQEANKPPDSWFDLKVNTHVYVTGLPDDVTVDEVRRSILLLSLEYDSYSVTSIHKIIALFLVLLISSHVTQKLSLKLPHMYTHTYICIYY